VILTSVSSGRRGVVRLTAKGWKQTFDDPIPLPGGRQLVTLQAAGNYITKLPKAESMAPEWQTATEALILAAGAVGRSCMRGLEYCRLSTAMNSRALRAHAEPQPKR
jgi:hypothetical protein